MFASLRTRLWLTYAILIAGVLCIVAVGIVVYLANNPTRLLAPRLQDVANRLVNRQELLGVVSSERLQNIALNTDRLANLRVLLFSATGDVLADSRPKEGALPFDLPSTSQEQPTLEGRDDLGQTWLYTTRTLSNGNLLVLAALQSRLPIRQIFRDDIFPPLFITALVALLLALLLAFWVSQWVAAPLQRLSRAAQAVAAGQHRPIRLEGPLEIQEFARAFNTMSARVQSGLQSQRDFVANVSHELKTPLTSIQGFAQAILDGAAGDPGQAASIIYDEAGRMNRLVLDLLDLARLDSGIADFRHEPVELADVLQRVVTKFTPQAQQARVDLRNQVDGRHPIIGDPDRLEQVFTNLVDNAIKHTPAEGRVTLSASQSEGSIAIAIADAGPGIPTEDLPRIFERFYQVDKSRQGGARRGVGLGLAISHEIVLAHRGSLTVQNSPGGGSVFVVKLPVVRPDDTTAVRRRTHGMRDQK